MLTRSRMPLVLAALSAFALIAASCGDSGTASPATTTSSQSATTTSSAPNASTTAGPTVTIPGTPIAVITDAEIPALVDEWGSGIGNPLDLAQRIIGYPVAIDSPTGSRAAGLSVTLDGTFPPEQPWNWHWAYQSISPEGTTADPALAFEPQMANLGWSPGINSRGSHSFSYNNETFPLGEIDATPGGLAISVIPDLSTIDPAATGTGLDFAVDLTAQTNYIPVPMLATLFDEVPVAPGARLTSLTLHTTTGPDGARMIELTYVCYLFDNSAEAAKDTYSTGLAGSPYQMGVVSAANPGGIDDAAAEVVDGLWTQPVVVLGRYPGEITVESDPSTGEVVSTVQMTLTPGSPELVAAG